MTQSLRTKWTETGSKKVEPKKINAVSRKIKKPEKPKRKFIFKLVHIIPSQRVKM